MAALVVSLRRARWAVTAAFVVAGAAGGGWGARIPEVRDRLDLSEGGLGAALFGLAVGAVAGSWCGGLLVRRLGSRSVVFLAWLAVGLTVCLPGLAGSWPALAGGLLLLGLSLGVLDVSMNGAGVQIEVASGQPVISGLHAGWSGGVLLGAALGNFAIAVGLAPSWHLAAMGALMIISGIVAQPYLPNGRIEPEHLAVTEGTGGTDHGGRRLAALAGIGGCVFLAEGAALDWSAVHVRELGGGPLLASLAVTGLSVGGLVGRLLGDGLTRRWGAEPLVRRGAVVAVAGMAAALVITRPVPVPVLFALLGFGLAPAVPLAFAAAGRSHGEPGIAVVTTAGYGAYMAGPALIGGLAGVVGLRGALTVPLVLAAAVIALAWSVGRDPDAVRAPQLRPLER